MSQVEGQHPYRVLRNGERPAKVRFIVCTLGLVAVAMCQMSRMVLNVTITQMVEPPYKPSRNDSDGKMADGSCPWPDKKTNSNNASRILYKLPPADPNTDEVLIRFSSKPAPSLLTQILRMHARLFDLDTDRALRLLSDGNAVPHAVASDAPRYKWSIKQQNVLLGGFFYSYFVFMVVGGRLAEIYGAKYVLMVPVIGSAVINLATPWMAGASFTLLVASRILMGALQAGVFPCMYALMSKWLTMDERSIFTPLIRMNLRLGMLLGSSIPGIVSGWPNTFYLMGSVSVVWSILWYFLASSDPRDSRWVSAAELSWISKKERPASDQPQSHQPEITQANHSAAEEISSCSGTSAKEITTGTHQEVRREKKKTPWRKILTAPAVIGLIIVKLTFNYALDFLSIQVPSYLYYVHHADKQTISKIASSIFIIPVLLIVFIGWLAKVAVQKKFCGLDKTGVRKLFQATSSIGMSVTFLLLTMNNCNLTYVTVMLLLCSFLSMFTSGGETMLPYDLSNEYPATIMAIANSFANISAVTITTVTAIVLGNQGGSFDRWNMLIYLIAGVNFIGGLAFCLLVKAEPIDLSDKDDRDNTVRE